MGQLSKTIKKLNVFVYYPQVFFSTTNQNVREKKNNKNWDLETKK